MNNFTHLFLTRQFTKLINVFNLLSPKCPESKKYLLLRHVLLYTQDFKLADEIFEDIKCVYKLNFVEFNEYKCIKYDNNLIHDYANDPRFIKYRNCFPTLYVLKCMLYDIDNNKLKSNILTLNDDDKYFRQLQDLDIKTSKSKLFIRDQEELNLMEFVKYNQEDWHKYFIIMFMNDRINYKNITINGFVNLLSNTKIEEMINSLEMSKNMLKLLVKRKKSSIDYINKLMKYELDDFQKNNLKHLVEMIIN